MVSLDLSKYGINLVLTPNMQLDVELKRRYKGLVKSVGYDENEPAFFFQSGKYKIGRQLGKGSYGASFEAIDKAGNRSAIKIIELRKGDRMMEDVINIVNESIINILLERETEREVDGPFVPRFYEVAYVPLLKSMAIRMEMLRGDLGSLIGNATPKENNTLVPTFIVETAYMLDYLFKRLQFNHRDMKSNNLMYTVGPDGKNIRVKLIDFGFCCLTWNGIRVQGTGYFPPTANCFSLFRDITQFVYELYITYKNRFTSKLVNQLKEILTVTVRGRKCKMYRGCPEYGMIKWPDNYDFLARMNVSNPAGEPAEIFRRLKQVFAIKDLDFARNIPSLAEAIACDPTEILDPVSGNCVPKGSPRGQDLVDSVEKRSPAPSPARKKRATTRKNIAAKPCKSPDQIRDPVTRRCRKVKAVAAAKTKSKTRKNVMTKPCTKPGQMRDPVTRRCKMIKA